MTPDEKTKLETALGFSEPLPLPNSQAEDLELTEMRLAADLRMADPIRDHTPRSAPARKVRGVLSILDQLDRKDSNTNRRFNT